MALGIGATTAVYTLFRDVLLRPLPVAEPERLVNLAAPGPKWERRAVTTPVAATRSSAIRCLLDPGDDAGIGESPVAVLSFEHWRARFASDPDIVGRSVLVNGRNLTVVGVAPQGFSGTIVGNRPQVFMPITLRWAMEPTRARDDENRQSYWVYLFARLPLRQD